MVPLNIKTDSSLLYSMIKTNDLIKVAVDNNVKALTITNDNMYGVLEFYKECMKNKIKPIIGLEVNLKSKIVLYAENYLGYKNLIKITTIKKERELTLKDLSKYSSGILAIVPFESRMLYNDLNKIYEDIFVSYKNEEEKSKIKLSNKVYMKEILCINKEDEKYLKYLWAIREGKNYLEMDDRRGVSLFPLPNDTLNNDVILEKCNLEIKMHEDLLPKYVDNSYDYLKKECIKGMKRLFGDVVSKKYALRLKEELNVIKTMGFCDYFLVVEDYINYARENGILVGPGRGSAAGSLVSYALSITSIDPLKYDLLFERFLNPERVTMPDIDVDFEDTRRDEVIKYCINKYGAKKVGLIVTFGTLASKQAIRDVARVMDIELKKIDILCKMIDARKSLKENYTKEVRSFLEINSELKNVYRVALKFEGLKRHTSTHAAGVVMSKKDLDESVPLDKNGDFYVSEYDKDYLEELGLLKMDFLGLKNLTLIKNILNEIGNLSFDDIPLNDSKAIDVFRCSNTTGIFQFESRGMVNFLKKFKPSNFDDITAALALFRPGPMKNIDSYIRRKKGLEKIDYFHPDLEEILKPTYGIIVYQEQIMQIAVKFAGYSFASADLLRRAMSKKKESILIKEREKFIKGAVNKGYDENLAIKIYDLIFKFADYGFNKSHSVSYAMISYKMAYLKAHFPNIFMKNLLTLAINSEEKTKQYIYECKKYGIGVSLPNINVSSDAYLVSNGKIIYPLTNIKGIGTSAVLEIIEERKKGKFKDIFDFISRCYKGSVTSKTLECLILSGAFDLFGISRKSLINNIEVLTNYGEIGSYLDDDMFKPEIVDDGEYTSNELMNYELSMFGFYLSNHPVTQYRDDKSIEIRNLPNYFDKQIEIIVYVDKIKEIETKRKDKMIFITGTDELSKTTIVVFPNLYKRLYDIKIGDIIKVRGKVEKRFDEYQINANSIVKVG